MKVILLSKIKKLGETGDIKSIADGYGKNYLLPKKLAAIYSEKNYTAFKEQKEAIENSSREYKEKALVWKEKIEAKDIVILENAGDNEKLYGSINSVRIADFVNDLIKSKEIKKSDVIIPTPIKYLGRFEIVFNFHPDVVFSKEIIVARSAEEAEKIRSGVKKEKQPPIVAAADVKKKKESDGEAAEEKLD
ncbi:MAG: 50S ribosomal protein L9 [Rickettsiales bacterium]|jgi:large subunit ribosomal protein L9|nr:50S ribosomal protein L9 [Rickettsiales bacterium]